ncbi:MAG: biotin--[Bacteroidales bacterium]|nr:biotin--[acetyl-CoA-carboxylase] ligase [Bacteroidales bacterium]
MLDKVDIRWIEETDSTQDEVRRHLSDYDNMSVIAALLQTAGRGQRGNKWHAKGGENLTFSMLLRFGEGGFPPLDVSDSFRITKAATLALVEYLGKKGIDSLIKWPNDIYVRNKKICGMLVENTLESGTIASSIVGIGLNVNQKDFPPQLVNPTSMAALTGESYNLRSELETLTACLASSFRRLLCDGDITSADQEYESLLYRKGSFHEYSVGHDGTRVEGKIIGVTPGGLLILENRKGELYQFAFKEISYII